MGVFDKMLDVMHLGDDDDEEFYDDDLYDDADEEPVEKSRFFRRHEDSGIAEDDQVEEEPKPKKQAKITPMRSHRSTGSNMEVCVIKPTQFEDSKEIIDTILTGRPVILNMEGIDLNLAQRIIDVTSGACLAIDGKLQKVSNYIFIITPANVDISGDLQGIMDAFDMSGIQTSF